MRVEFLTFNIFNVILNELVRSEIHFAIRCFRKICNLHIVCNPNSLLISTIWYLWSYTSFCFYSSWPSILFNVQSLRTDRRLSQIFIIISKARRTTITNETRSLPLSRYFHLFPHLSLCDDHFIFGPCLSFVVPLALLFLAWFSWPCRFTVQRIEERKVLECAIKRREIANAYNSNWRHKGFSINPRSDMTRDRPRFDYLVPGPSDFYVCSFIAGSTLSVRPTKPLFHSGLVVLCLLETISSCIVCDLLCSFLASIVNVQINV